MSASSVLLRSVYTAICYVSPVACCANSLEYRPKWAGEPYRRKCRDVKKNQSVVRLNDTARRSSGCPHAYAGTPGRQRTLAASGPAGQADASAMVDEAMGEGRPFLRREQRLEVPLDPVGISLHRQAEAIRQAFHVCIDEDRRLAEGRPEHDVRGLATDSGQRCERL